MALLMASVANCLALASAMEIIVGLRLPSTNKKARTAKNMKMARIKNPTRPGFALNLNAEYRGRGHLLAIMLPPSRIDKAGNITYNDSCGMWLSLVERCVRDAEVAG